MGNQVILRAMCNYGSATAQWAWIQRCFGRTFTVTLRRTHMAENVHYFCAVMQSVGSNGAANDFAYRLDYHSCDRSYSYEGMPLGIHGSVDVAIENGDCLGFEATAEQLQYQSGLLRIKSAVSSLLSDGEL
ncbi:E3 ubiquitin-protein ligase sina-like [Amblyomma americanum]